jgi:hypothetical protein
VRAPKRAAPFKGLLFILKYVFLLTSKTMILSKREFIRNETELLQRLKTFLQTQSASGAHWLIDQGSPKVLHSQSQTDFQATLKIDGQVHHFAVETKLNPSRENVKHLREAAQGQKANPCWPQFICRIQLFASARNKASLAWTSMAGYG